MKHAAQKNKKWSKRHKRYLRLCYKTKARRVAGLYLTLLCGYHASVARETPLLISNAHSRASRGGEILNMLPGNQTYFQNALSLDIV